MPSLNHRQYDELPLRDFTLTFDTDAQTWPPLNADDKVTMLIAQAGAGGSKLAVELTKTDTAARKVRWSPSGSAIAVPGTHKFVVRVTQADGKSYTHPETGTWDLVIDPSPVTTDLVDPA